MLEAREVADLDCTARPRLACRSPAGSATPGFLQLPWARLGSSVRISRSRVSRRWQSASIAPWASSIVVCAAGQSSSIVTSQSQDVMGPGPTRVVEADGPTQQQLGQAVAERASSRHPDHSRGRRPGRAAPPPRCLTRTAASLPAESSSRAEQFSVATVGLDAVRSRGARDLARRGDHALDAAAGRASRARPYPLGLGLIGHAHRPGQSGTERGRGCRPSAAHRECPAAARFPRRAPPCDGLLGRVHVQTDEGSSLRHGLGPPIRLRPPRGVKPRRHETHPTTRRSAEPAPATSLGRTDQQSILSTPSRELAPGPAAGRPIRHRRPASGGRATRRAAPGIAPRFLALHVSARAPSCARPPRARRGAS